MITTEQLEGIYLELQKMSVPPQFCDICKQLVYGPTGTLDEKPVCFDCMLKQIERSDLLK